MWDMQCVHVRCRDFVFLHFSGHTNDLSVFFFGKRLYMH
jgi:hypothetical protein